MPEFVNLEGLTCLIKVGAEADQNYQNYILRGWCLATGHLSSPGRKAGNCHPSPVARLCRVGLGKPCPAPRAITLPALCLAALSQIMLFVDGMQGVINHNETVQWLYTLSGSPVSARCPWGGCLCPPLPGAVPLHCPSGHLPHPLPSGSAPWYLWVHWVLHPPIWKSPKVPRAPYPGVSMLLGTELE